MSSPTFGDSSWVAASATRNWCQQDPILDWLDLYGEAKGFRRDKDYEGYDPETDMGQFLREKGRAFEAAVMTCLEQQFQVQRIGTSSRDAYDATLVVKTAEAIENGVEIIYQPVLWDQTREMFGMPDLLVRSDILDRITEEPILSAEEAKIRHYRAVDIKFTSLDLNSKGCIGNDGGDRRRKAQLLVYNRALGQLQGYEPPVAYILGRGFKYTVKGETKRGDACFDKLGAADMADPELHQLVDEAARWRRNVRANGGDWHVFPSPTVPELFPNMSNQQDSPWHMAKREIAAQIGELTLLWNVTPKNRPLAHQAGIITFSDTRCEDHDFGLKDKKLDTLRKLIEINRDGCPDQIRPARLTADEDMWREPNGLEFYVDFETVSDLDDDFSSMPIKSGQTLIYMVGCGHMENGEWQFKVFTCDQLTIQCERAILDAWHQHMAEVKRQLDIEQEPTVFHWSHAEQSFLNTAFNSARKRHPDANWPELSWYDFLVRVMREEPVVVKGALAFGLKSIAKAMHKNDLIQTNWTNGPGDGLGAMVGAWRCDAKARAEGKSMKDYALMKGLEEYNEVDCQVMQQIIAYLRAEH